MFMGVARYDEIFTFTQDASRAKPCDQTSDTGKRAKGSSTKSIQIYLAIGMRTLCAKDTKVLE